MREGKKKLFIFIIYFIESEDNWKSKEKLEENKIEKLASFIKRLFLINFETVLIDQTIQKIVLLGKRNGPFGKRVVESIFIGYYGSIC